MTENPPITDQRRSWDGDTGAYWADHADRYDEGVAAYQERFPAAAGITTSTDVLDVGCGAGLTTRDAARLAPAGSALGVDLSARLLDLARARAAREGVPRATFQQLDAQVHAFAERSFDVAISRHGSMFFGDRLAAFANVATILRDGLDRRARHAVHLSADVETARRVGARRGACSVLVVDAGAMHADGHAFAVSANGVRLVETVSARHVQESER